MCRHRTWHKPGTRAFFSLMRSMNMHGRAAAMVRPIGDKKTLLPAESPVISSGCAGRGRQEGQLAKQEMEAREAAGSAANAKVCALTRARVSYGSQLGVFFRFSLDP